MYAKQALHRATPPAQFLFPAESFTGNNTKNPQETHNNELKVLVPVLAVLAAAAFVSFIIYRRTRPHRSYTGLCETC
jgi:hypothetical protein